MIPFPRSKCSSRERDKKKTGPSKAEMETMASAGALSCSSVCVCVCVCVGGGLPIFLLVFTKLKKKIEEKIHLFNLTEMQFHSKESKKSFNYGPQTSAHSWDVFFFSILSNP